MPSLEEGIEQQQKPKNYLQVVLVILNMYDIPSYKH